MADTFQINPNSLGSDISWDGDLDPSFKLVTGTRNMQLHTIRRLITDRGSLFYEQGYGLNLERYINAELSRRNMIAMQNDIRNELLKDERVQDVEVIVEWVPETSTLKIKTRCITTEGSFENVANVSSIGVGFEGIS